MRLSRRHKRKPSLPISESEGFERIILQKFSELCQKTVFAVINGLLRNAAFFVSISIIVPLVALALHLVSGSGHYIVCKELTDILRSAIYLPSLIC